MLELGSREMYLIKLLVMFEQILMETVTTSKQTSRDRLVRMPKGKFLLYEYGQIHVPISSLEANLIGSIDINAICAHIWRQKT